MNISLELYGGRKYEWVGGFGTILKSYERGVKPGDVRVIGDELFYAAVIYPHGWFPSEVCWTVQEATVERIREIQNKFMRVL